MRAIESVEARESLRLVESITVALGNDTEDARGAMLARVIGSTPARMAVNWAKAQRAAKEA